MKVIKRDGRAVEFDRNKIVIAIEKANTEVKGNEKATKQEIEEIIEYIEDIDKKRILVEDIQDIIEQKLMEIKKYDLAKKYIVYRYTRALVRKQNTTDESILGIIKNTNRQIAYDNSNKNNIIASTQRDLIAGEVSKDLTRRVLLPEKISKAHNENILFFHDSEYFIQPIINSCLINIDDMLENGTVINGKMIDSPKSFQVACTVMIQILLSAASGQYGSEYVDIKCLGKYLRKSYEKYKKRLEKNYKNKLTEELIEEIATDNTKQEMENGIQTVLYQINTAITIKGKAPNVVMLLDTELEDEYKKENEMIHKEIIFQLNQGIKNENGKYEAIYLPKLVLDQKEIQKIKEHKFDQGVVSLNILQVGIDSEKDEDKFWGLLDERCELCHEALMYRHYALLGTVADMSPVHWKYGAVARLEKGETIDKLLKDKYSTLTLGYIGLDNAIKKVKGNECQEKECNSFEKEIIKFLKNKTDQWTKQSGIQFIIKETKAV